MARINLTALMLLISLLLVKGGSGGIVSMINENAKVKSTVLPEIKFEGPVWIVRESDGHAYIGDISECPHGCSYNHRCGS